MSQLVAEAAPPPTRRVRSGRRLAGFDIAAIAFLLVLAVAVIAPGLLSPHDPLEVQPGQTLLPPSLAHPSAPTTSVAICTRASSTAPHARFWRRSSPS
ncbi:hypothetical protein [Microbacterium sp. NIBRBAC000506063]|uniref:hypothetical protein n=1 Tax=Microbacterium sp. NIBRBAC000506063 TaxID=2734618 RepID=UPI001CB6D780|nr:hypothetical protein [Microbacterium sp. NIBRBAC000506063]